MPGFDGSGSAGGSPMSGGGRGFCSSTGNKGGFSYGEKGQRGRTGRCRGNRAGRSRGFGRVEALRTRSVSAGPDNNQERLEAQVSELRDTVNLLQQRLENLS